MLTFLLCYHYLDDGFSCFVFFFWYIFNNFVKPKLFYQYLFESLQKQQLRSIVLNIHVFNLINFTKLCSLLVTFLNTQQTFQRCHNVVVEWYDVTTSNIVKPTFNQRFVCQRWNLQRWTTSNQLCLCQRWY